MRRMLIGGDGLAAIQAFGVEKLSAAPNFRRLSLETIGEDVLETLTFGALNCSPASSPISAPCGKSIPAATRLT